MFPSSESVDDRNDETRPEMGQTDTSLMAEPKQQVENFFCRKIKMEAMIVGQIENDCQGNLSHSSRMFGQHSAMFLQQNAHIGFRPVILPRRWTVVLDLLLVDLATELLK